VWVANSLDGTVSRIDPGTDGVVQTTRVGSDPSGIAVARSRVWVASHGDGTLDALDATTGHLRRRLAVGDGPSDVATAGGSIWVADDIAGTVARLDANTGAAEDVVHVGDAPTTLVGSAAGVWVLDRLDSTISHIDPATDSVVSTTPLRGDAEAVVRAARGAWVADGSTGRLLRVDGRTGEVAQTIDLHARAVALASTRTGVWVAFAGAGAAHRGGTLRIVSTSPSVDSLDPASSNSPNLGNVFNLTNDGLVTLDHAAGPDGTRLVPDLAVTLPRPANGGLVYSFRLRPGIHYSTGGTVRPSDVRRSFERLFELGSAGTAYYASIVGASTCSRRRCNLAAGIAVDNRAGTVTFHLAHPDPDFLYKLTLPFADVVPASTAAHPRFIASTGPYEVGRYVAGHRLLLVRNPRFRQWSIAAQPAGFPDRIAVKLGAAAPVAAAAVAAGRADFVSSLGVLPPAERTFFLIRHPERAQINPTLGTNFLFLNVNVPPFDDVRVRRALNFALDRARIVAADGGRSAAEPACQVLPPRLPGYQPYCPFTVPRRPDGLWHGPDLARARRLVAASHTTGMRVRVWDTLGPPVFLREGQATVTALRELGYRASLRLLPDSRYFAYTNDSRHRAQVIDGGWSAEYPSADDIIGKLTCRYFTPGDGVETTDAGELCNRALDRQVARAAALQTIDAPAANRLWAHLDRLLTDRAVWLPTVTPNEIDLLSARVANYQYNPVLGALIDQLWVR
jgi:YVTN family beta-propeller protein